MVINLGRTTIKDVAREAGVSLSTVNRALTGKSGISKELKQRILDTVERLDYKVNSVAGSLARSAIRIGIVLPIDWEDYYSDIYEGIYYEMGCLVDWKVEGVTLKYSDKGDNVEQRVLECFMKMHEDGITAIIFCHDNDTTYEKALAFTVEKNIEVVCVGIGLLDRGANFPTVIEVNAYKCGRIAADLLENSLPQNSRVAIFVGNKQVTPHADKIRGFSDRIKEGGKLTLSAVFEYKADDNIAYNTAKDLLESDGIDGIFLATSAVSGVCRAVSESGNSGKIKIVATDLSAECKKYIREGVIYATLYQNTFFQGVKAVDLLYKHFSAGKDIADKILVPPVIYTKESLIDDAINVLYTM